MSVNKLPYNLEIKPQNKQFHYDLDMDILAKKNGLFSFVIKINDGNIIDYIVLDYGSVSFVVREETVITRNY